MAYVPNIALTCAILTSFAAAVTDSRRGTIPNSVTLPFVFVAPGAYGIVGGFRAGVASAIAASLCGVVPYVLFRIRAMGGGDVKLFAAVGALTGYDLFAGLRIELATFAAALLAVLWRQARNRQLTETLRNTASAFFREGLPTALEANHSSTVRLGRFVFLATTLHATTMFTLGRTS